MKNLLIKITLITVLVVACNTASAAFSDSTNTLALWHCDATNWAGTEETTPDDNSSGRAAKDLQINAANAATLMPGSPYGGSYLAFDGTDRATANGVLDPAPADHLRIDVSFRANSFPAAGIYKSLVWTYPVKVYLYNGANVMILTYDAAGNPHFLGSTKTINADTWYSVNVVVSDGTVEVIVGNDAEGYETNSGSSGTGLLDASSASHVTVGWDPFDESRDVDADLDEIRISSVTPAPPPENLTACIKDDNGSPTMFINDKPVAPMMFYGYAWDLPGNPNCEFAKQAELAKNAGIHLYTFPINFQGIFGDGITYWDTVDSIFTAVTNLDNEAMMIPRFYIYPSQWYMTANPDIHMEFSDGSKSRICLASEKWRTYMQARVGDFVAHCEEKFGNNIIGYHLTLMETGEWFYERSWESVFSGYSENMRLGFANWVTNKYHTEAALKTAWNDSGVTFTTITLPTTSERSNSSSAFFRDPATEMKVIDFYEYKNLLVPETIDIMAKAVKDVTSSNKLVVTFYGYVFELSGVPKGPQITGHLATKKLLESPYIDIIAAPISYGNRRPGGISAFMSAADSVRTAGKLWFNEDDTRTYLSSSPHFLYPTLQQTQWAHDNSFARILSRRMGCWYMDLFNEGWLNSTGLWQNISKLQSIYEGQLGVKSPWNPEVAVIIDERSTYYLACNNNLTSPLYSVLRTRLYRMGVPFNIYLLEDVLDGTVTLPKVNIFLGAWYLTSSERVTLHTALSGKAAIWFHGAGYINETGAETTNITDLTGFSLVEESGPAQITCVANSPWNDGLTGTSFKPALFVNGSANVFETMVQNISYDIRWAIDDGSAISLGTYNNGHTGLAVMDYSGFKSFYCGIAGIPSKFLRNVCKNMGVHVYVDDDYAMDTDGKFFSINSPKVESQAIVLSNNNYLTCMNLGTIKTSSGGIVNDNFSSIGETRTCWIGTNSIGGFADNAINKGLWHCDNSYSPASLISDDDNSSGRTAVNPVLNEEHIYTHVTAPMLIPNSPKGGNYFRFDGIDDNMIAQSAWTDESNTFSGNVSMRWLDLPPVSDNVDGILVSQPWRLYLQNAGSGNGKLLFRVMNAAATGYTELESAVTLSSNMWYDINFEVFNNAVTLIVNGDSASTPLIGGMLNISSDVVAGCDAASAHYFKGDLDEVRFGAVIPEPMGIWIMTVLGALFNKRNTLLR